MSTREEQIAALRQAVDWFESHPEVPMPVDFNGTPYARDFGGFGIHITELADEAKPTLAAIARALPGKVEKQVRGGYFDLVGRVAGIRILVIAGRADVCKRIVTGTREVTEEVPDPSAPTITVTKTVEDVEWRCSPILDEQVTS